MEVDGFSCLDAVKVNGRVPGEEYCLVGTGDIFHLNDPGVQVRLQEDLVAVRNEILRQPHDRWWFCGGGRQGWTGRRVHARDLSVVQNDHGDNADDGRDGQDDKGGGDSLAYEGLFGHGGCFLPSALKILLLDWKSLMSLSLYASGLQ